VRVTLNLIDVRGGPDGQAPPDVIEPAELTSWPGARGPLLSGFEDSWVPCEGLVQTYQVTGSKPAVTAATNTQAARRGGLSGPDAAPDCDGN
jgi:hypothetical protein